MAIGWPGANGDVFKSTVKLLASRHAQKAFVHVEKKKPNESKRGAYRLASDAHGSNTVRTTYNGGYWKAVLRKQSNETVLREITLAITPACSLPNPG
jgi:hypothetical protein